MKNKSSIPTGNWKIQTGRRVRQTTDDLEWHQRAISRG